MTGSENGGPADDGWVSELHGLRTLTVVVVTSDDGFMRGVTAVCLERGHTVSPLRSFVRLRSFPRRVVLLLDTGAQQSDRFRVAATVAATHPGLPTVVASFAPRARSKDGFRLVDRYASCESIVDEVELAHIGIPAFVEEPFRRSVPAALGRAR
jgi:hypothetical protein